MLNAADIHVVWSFFRPVLVLTALFSCCCTSNPNQKKTRARSNNIQLHSWLISTEFTSSIMLGTIPNPIGESVRGIILPLYMVSSDLIPQGYDRPKGWVGLLLSRNIWLCHRNDSTIYPCNECCTIGVLGVRSLGRYHGLERHHVFVVNATPFWFYISSNIIDLDWAPICDQDSMMRTITWIMFWRTLLTLICSMLEDRSKPRGTASETNPIINWKWNPNLGRVCNSVCKLVGAWWMNRKYNIWNPVCRPKQLT